MIQDNIFTIKINLRKVCKLGFLFMIIGFVFGIIETAFWGFNFRPINDNELLCDKIALFIGGLGCFLYAVAILLKLKITIDELF